MNAPRLRSVFGTTSFVCLAGAIAACSSLVDFEPEAAFADRSNGSDYGDAGTSFAKAEDEQASRNARRGSPLCGAETCMPDNDGRYASSPTCTLDTAGTTLDAGTSADAGTTDSPACRVRRHESSIEARCEQGSNVRGTDGASCQSGAECAPGFDCVPSAKGGVCRRYCCSGSCETHSTDTKTATFCDVQPLVDDLAVVVPVCMPRKPCALLEPGACGAKETCAVVTEKGDTSCVPVGTAGPSESCEVTRCAKDLTCFGSPGDRTCYQLCRVNMQTCTDGKKCVTGSVFQDQTYGVCRSD